MMTSVSTTSFYQDRIIDHLQTTTVISISKLTCNQKYTLNDEITQGVYKLFMVIFAFFVILIHVINPIRKFMSYW